MYISHVRIMGMLDRFTQLILNTESFLLTFWPDFLEEIFSHSEHFIENEIDGNNLVQVLVIMTDWVEQTSLNRIIFFLHDSSWMWLCVIIIFLQLTRARHFFRRFPSARAKIWGGYPRGVMVKAMDCRIVVSEFVFQSRYYVHFRANTLGKGMNPLILPAMG